MQHRPSIRVARIIGAALVLASVFGCSGVARADDPVPVVRALDAPDVIDPATIDALIAQLQEAKETKSRVVVSVTGADAAAPVDADRLKALAAAAREAQLAVIVTPSATEGGGGGAALLYAIAPIRLTTGGASLSPLDPALAGLVRGLPDCEPCQAIASMPGNMAPPDAKLVGSNDAFLASVGAAPEAQIFTGSLRPESDINQWVQPDGTTTTEDDATANSTATAKSTATADTGANRADDGGLETWFLVLFAFLLLAAAAVLLRLRVTMTRKNNRPERQPEADGRSRAKRLGIPPAGQSLPTTKPKRRTPAKSDTKPQPAIGGPGTAVLRTVLQPDGYAEIEGILRRVEWSGSGIKPAPGTLVHIRTDGRRLLV